VVRGERFKTRWIFDGDQMLDYDIQADGFNESWGEIRNPVMWSNGS